MPTRTIPLNKFAQATANAAGRAVAQLGPASYGDVWTLTSANMRASSNTLEAQGFLYLGNELPGNLQGTTQAASTGDTAGLTVQLYQGHTITAVWTGADPGATCTLTLYGSRTITGG